MYLPYMDGECEHSGFIDPFVAKEYLEKSKSEHRSLVVVYVGNAPDGTRAEYYDWATETWRKTTLDAHGAVRLSRQQ